VTSVVAPRTLGDALRLKDENPNAVPIHGGTDLMVDLNFGRSRPNTIIDLERLEALRGWAEADGDVMLGAGVTFSELLDPPLADRLPGLAEAARSVGSPQIRNRGTLGGNLGTASPAGDALPPLLVAGARVATASAGGGARELQLDEFLTGPRRNALRPGELITSIRVRPRSGSQTFMKVGPRNAMAIAVVSLAVAVDEERGELRAAFGSAAPTPRLISLPLAQASTLPERLDEACSPIDDVRGSARYRRHALTVLAARALKRCLR
jgi:CO/xanthine dehydrogenase FAD-binding subunit